MKKNILKKFLIGGIIIFGILNTSIITNANEIDCKKISSDINKYTSYKIKVDDLFKKLSSKNEEVKNQYFTKIEKITDAYLVKLDKIKQEKLYTVVGYMKCENEKKLNKENSFGKNGIFTTEDIAIISKKLEELNKKREKYSDENINYNLTQGDFKAEYFVANDYKKDIDKIKITIGDKIYNIPGIYNEKQRNRYLEEIKIGGCKSEGKITEPSSGDCIFASEFRNFIGFSPSGYYLLYNLGGYEHSYSITKKA